MKNIIGIQCRYSSSRLPGKALLPLGEITILGAVILRCLSSNLDTYILTSNDESDDAIEKHANLYPIKGVIRGSLKNVQERYRNLAIKTNPNYIIRVTADNPFTDSLGIQKILEYALNKKVKYARFSNNELPKGFHSECFEAKQLFLYHNQDELSDEHVTFTMRKNSIHNSISGLGYNFNSLTLNLLNCSIDTLNDYKKALYFIRYIEKEDFSSLNLTKKLISLKGELTKYRSEN